MIRIVIVNEKESERKFVQALLACHSDFEVVGHGQDGYAALKLIDALKPDIMIIDAHLSDTSGIKLIPLIKSNPLYTTKIGFLLLTSFTEEAQLSKLINHGITAYLLKETDMETLPQAVRTLHKEGHFFSPKVHDKVFRILLEMIRMYKDFNNPSASAGNTWLRRDGKTRSQQTMHIKFSATEWRLIALIVQGYSSEEIAECLSLSGGTIRNYVSAILRKTGQRNRTQLVMFLVNNELLNQSRS
jgi:DNA-binding NarL/FixJ family response regulator